MSETDRGESTPRRRAEDQESDRRANLTPGLCGQVACLLEVTAAKAGNVHRYRDFEDTTYLDFLLSAAAIAPVLDRAPGRGIGETVLDAVERTRELTGRNTNLGIVLLLAPLAAVFGERDRPEALRRRLEATTVEDADLVYRAIRLARPGGLGEVSGEDVRARPTRPLREVMALASGRDLVARQYENGFRDLPETGLPALRDALEGGFGREDAVVFCHLRWLASFPDTLIRRKCGDRVAARASALARSVLESGWPQGDESRQRFVELDDWLRADGHRRNPGTSADLTAATLFVALEDGLLRLPP